MLTLLITRKRLYIVIVLSYILDDDDDDDGNDNGDADNGDGGDGGD